MLCLIIETEGINFINCYAITDTDVIFYSIEFETFNQNNGNIKSFESQNSSKLISILEIPSSMNIFI